MTGSELVVLSTAPTAVEGRYADLERRIAELHSYSVPEVLALPIAPGSPAYLAWLRASVAAVEGGEG
jgi:periplasmic divalent cation tolerance protein